MPHGNRVVAYGFDNVYRALVAGHNPKCAVFGPCGFRYWHHVGKMMTSIKTEDKIIVYDGKLGTVEEFPADEICERKVAILPFAVQSITLYGIFIRRR